MSSSFLSRGAARREPRERRSMNDELGPVPCPHCGYSLVARVDARGPYFFCLCPERQRAPGADARDADSAGCVNPACLARAA